MKILKKKGYKLSEFYIEMYNTFFYIGILTDKELKAFEKDRYIELDVTFENATGMVFDNNGSAFIIFDKNEFRTKEKQGLISHEATHLAYIILDRLGIKHDIDNQEPLAYMIEYIVNKVNTI